VTITDAAVDGETTVVWCTLLATDGRGRCPGCGTAGVYRDSVERRSRICRWLGIRCSCGSGSRATAAPRPAASG
jgi:hypothetical protein